MKSGEIASAAAHDSAVSADLRQPAEVVRREMPPASKSALVELAYTEYMRRREEGENPDIEVFCARFPPCRSSLRRLLQAYQFLDDNPKYLAEEHEARWPEAGERHGDLTLLRELGRGAFARVFLATEASTGDRLVAVKFSVHGDAEARTLGRLSHPHIVPILSARLEESTGLTTVCMPYLGSATLEDVLDRAWPAPDAPRPRKAAVILEVIRACAQPEDPPAGSADRRLEKGSYTDGVIHLAVQLAQALAFLHGRHVCHRDLKPSNVLLDPSGKPLLLDFNLSTSEREIALHTGGTPRYMAPEQIHAFLSKSAEGMDERADLFSLGAIVYELLTGDHPYGPISPALTGVALAQFLRERLKTGFRPLRTVCPDLERPVAAVIDRCLAVNPAERPGSAAELAAQLKRQFSPRRRLRRWLAARPRRVLATLCLLALSAAAAGYAWSAMPPYSERAYQQGETSYRAGDYDAAEKHFDRAVQADPSNPRFRFARGCARLKQSKSLPGDTPELNTKLDQAWGDLKQTQQGPPDALTLAVKAYIESRKQNPQAAIGEYDQLAGAGPPSLMVLNNRAYCSILMNKSKPYFENAQRDLDRAAELDPNCQAVFYNRALLAWNKRLKKPNLLIPAQALEDIEHALRLGPATPALYRDAALLYAQTSCDDLRRVPVLPDAPTVTAVHSRVREQRIERALFYLRQAIAQGEPSTLILKQPSIQCALSSHPAFEALRKMKPQSTIPPRELRLIDPVDLSD